MSSAEDLLFMKEFTKEIALAICRGSRVEDFGRAENLQAHFSDGGSLWIHMYDRHMAQIGHQICTDSKNRKLTEEWRRRREEVLHRRRYDIQFFNHIHDEIDTLERVESKTNEQLIKDIQSIREEIVLINGKTNTIHQYVLAMNDKIGVLSEVCDLTEIKKSLKELHATTKELVKNQLKQSSPQYTSTQDGQVQN